MSETVAVNWAPDAVQGKMSKPSKPGFWGAAALSLALHLSVIALLAGLSLGREKAPAPITVELVGFSESYGKGNVHTVASRHSAGRKNYGTTRHSVAMASKSRTEQDMEPVTATSGSGPAEKANAGEFSESPGQGGQAAGQYLARNFNVIRDRIHSCLVYPRLARKLGWQGEAVVAFVIGPDGGTSELILVQSCGYKALDQNVLRAIHAAEPFQPPGERVRLVLPVAYKLIPDSKE
jgi:TonB family protein